MQPANKCPMINEQSISHFFSVLREKKKSYEENYKYFAPKLAPKFSIFNFVRRDENALSYIIANLLDPMGEHEQGSVFIELFTDFLILKMGDKPNENLKLIGENHKSAKCVTESTTGQIVNSQRRIDIVIDFGNFGIGIENKPWAFDQKDQLSDYSKELEKRYHENFLLIYLTGSDWEVSEYTIQKEELKTLKSKSRFIQITYQELKEWIIDCEAKCQADRVRNFLRDFADYCDIQFGNGIIMSDENLIKEYLLGNPTNIELAFQIEKVLPKLKDQILCKLVDKIKENFSSDWIVDTDSKLGFGSTQNTFINFKKPEWKEQYITIMIEAGGWCYGIRKQKTELRYLSNDELELFQKQLKAKIYKYKSGWVSSFLIYFDDPFKYWHSTPSEFSKVAADNTELVETIHKYVTSVYDVIKQSNIQM